MAREIFDEVLETFENEDIKEFANKCLDTIPDYIYEVPASSTLRYHPAYACETPLGLAKHTVALCRFLNHMFEVESIGCQFNSRERDLLRIAGMMHDTRKSGTQEDYEKSHYTKFNHPLQAAEVIRGLDGLPAEEIEFIAHAIESHMGAFNTDKRYPNTVLPKPEDKYQIILHLADYLASRKEIEMRFDITPERRDKPKEKPTLEGWVIPFGKHKGQTLLEVNALDPGYISWAKKNLTSEPMATLIKEL